MSLLNRTLENRSTPAPPGLNPARMLRQAASAIERCSLDLEGLTVLTEAATGAYIITPIMAALAGAQVIAATRSSVYGTFEYVRQTTLELAALAGVAHRIRVVDDFRGALLSEADIVTNSGHLRPIDAPMVGAMKSGCVIPLMYEAWEFRESDVDRRACERHSVSIAGTNECHPAVDVFSFLGVLALKLLLDAGVPVYGSNILVLCDNPFAPFLEMGLQRAGARVTSMREFPIDPVVGGAVDAIVIAMRPGPLPILGAREIQAIAQHFAGAVVAQFWGDIDRRALSSAGVPFWPVSEVAPGHMGILLSDIGSEPVVRLQCGGLKVGQIMAGAVKCGVDPVRTVVESGFGQALELSS